MKTLVLAEKPSVGKDIARVLQCRGGGQGYLEGDKYVVTWALGHLVTLADPECYNEKYKTWNMEHLPIIPEKQDLVVIKETSKQYKTVKSLLIRNDVTQIVIATDAGREGELVARWILEKAGCRKPIKRLWISSVTDNAIKSGFNNLKDGKEYVNLANSAKARAEADWLVGINATRCLTTKYNSQLSCGRVQTPTVAIIAKREDDIRKFAPQKYYGLTMVVEGFELVWQGSNNDNRCFDKNKIDDIYNRVKAKKDAVITELSKAAKKAYPPRLYDLTELQRDANKRYGFSPKDTLSIMQSLYEKHKLLTYPRTDSRYVTTDIVATIPDRLKACSVRPYTKVCANLLKTKITANQNFVDNNKVSDHHAIIPTEESRNVSALNEKERKIYDLVVIRFLSVLHPPFEYEQTSLKVMVDKENFIARGKRVISRGFKDVSGDMAEDGEEEDSPGSKMKEQTLPELKKGESLKINNVRITEGKTSPPSPFNEATLLSAMENPSKYMENADKTISKTLAETGGLGTVATRADIIEKLFDNFLLEKKGKDIFTTSKSRQLLKLVPVGLRSPELTGEWEQKLSKISKGALSKDEFIKAIKAYTQELTTEIKQSNQVFRHDNITTNKCPDCGKFMLEVNGKKGKMLVCQDRECNHRENLSLKTNSRCPHCRKNLEIVGEGEKKRIVCECGYREKYEAFSKRVKENSNKLSKKDVDKYLDKINKDDNGYKNNPFAQAFKDVTVKNK